MDLLNKALELCAEIEQRQAELRAIITQLIEKIESQPDETVGCDATSCVHQAKEAPTQILSDLSDLSDSSDRSDLSDSSENPAPSDKIEKPAAPDLRKAFTINDRFRFRRELFGGDDKAFVAAIDRMGQCKDYNEIEAFISTLGWDASNEDVVAFKEIISTFYNGYHL
ncbi:MAG: hypothetical protein K2J12_09535 [Muribaculaceae bacterium]|nr:hypothetical protein [Muribaculaceae bacterium]